MFIELKDLFKHKIETKDGNLYKAQDFLFDDASWQLRYVVMDTAKWLPGKKVLISPSTCRASGNVAEFTIKTQLTRGQIEKAPTLEEGLPVSRQYETHLHDYYEWLPYWLRSVDDSPAPYYDVPFPSSSTPAATLPAKWKELTELRQQRFESNLRSCSEVLGYKIKSQDGQEFGRVSNMIIDSKRWLVYDLILDSHKWLPGGKQIVCSPFFITGVNHLQQNIDLALNKEVLLHSLDYNFNHYNSNFRGRVIKYYFEHHNDDNQIQDTA